RSELAVPMIFQGRLVGVLNFESPDANRFPDDRFLIALVFAVHTAQAIYQHRLEELYHRLLGEDQLDRVADTVVNEGGKFMEAPLATVFLWDVPRQELVLGASSRAIEVGGRELRPGEACYPDRGIGFVRWAFENRMLLRVDDVPAYKDPQSARHRQQIEK